VIWITTLPAVVHSLVVITTSQRNHQGLSFVFRLVLKCNRCFLKCNSYLFFKLFRLFLNCNRSNTNTQAHNAKRTLSYSHSHSHFTSLTHSLTLLLSFSHSHLILSRTLSHTLTHTHKQIYSSTATWAFARASTCVTHSRSIFLSTPTVFTSSSSPVWKKVM